MMAAPNSWAFEATGLPDPAGAVARVLTSSRMSLRKKLGLVLYAEGLPIRQCARMVGLRDHMGLWRAARRHGLLEIHNERQSYRQSVVKLARAQRLLASRRPGLMNGVRAWSLTSDALLALESSCP
jgi:hypothetical protein